MELTTDQIETIKDALHEHAVKMIRDNPDSTVAEIVNSKEYLANREAYLLFYDLSISL